MAQVPQVPGDVNQDELINQVNNAVRELNNRDTVQVYKDEAGTRRVILDKDGLRTSPEGVDVYTATNDQLTFNSNNNVFKIVQSGEYGPYEGAVIASGAKDTITIPHNLGYTPAFMAYCTSPTLFGFSAGIVNMPILYCVAGTAVINLFARADSTNLYFDFLNVTGSSQDLTTLFWSFKYYLLQETAN